MSVHTNGFIFYKLFTKVINKDCCQRREAMKVMMIVMMMTDLMIRQQLSLMMTMMTVMLPLCVCVCVCVCVLSFSSSSDWIPEQRGVLLIFARMSGVCVCVCDRESVDYTLLSNTESRHFSSVCNYSEHTAS